ncbi:MAG: hypothetical protein PHH23_06930 [Paludibacteraceae bacterium]|nr:hypothetical protein [Paludibacteraceae bacterium]
MTIQQLSVFLENKSGRLLEVTKVLAEHDINMSAFSIADSSDFGMLRMIVDKPEAAYTALKNNNFSVNITQVVGLVVPDTAGSLYNALEILKKDNIEVEYMYAFSFKDNATVIIRSANAEQTAAALKTAGFQTMD